MKHKNFAPIALAIALLLLVSQACKNSNGDMVESTQIETGSKISATDSCQDQFNESTLDSAQIVEGNLDFEGHQRDYVLFLPKNYTQDMKFPLVIYLHSYGSTAKIGMNLTMLNQVANNNDFIVVYPSGKLNWNSGIGEYALYPTPDIDDVGFINALMDTLSNDYSIDAERIYATGFSNGGFMAYKLACQLSHRIAAVASVAGVLSTNTEADCNPLHTMPVLHIHGTKDSHIPIDGRKSMLSVDQTLQYWMDFNRCKEVGTTNLPDVDPEDGSTVKKVSYTNCSNDSDVIYYKIINGGHNWPCSVLFGLGSINEDLNASFTIWNFFKDHQLESIISED